MGTTRAWGTRDRIRVRNSPAKPFITDSTVMRLATPNTMPSIDARATTREKPRLRPRKV